ncbi:hypothetical protein K432DRAFT_151437 [Lepidopterella palustris CBS 459.81]|uniref:Uncharacterized protein n=1 Tax=Lepidopterella palustris CBS 459.81 TaxID=1314670 RepID=A0A8E2E2Z7_9PEZI|nr:hypothetical protein K432DRAFT_151437 [Lepidopterella palustris CBS 459.81]
MTLTRRIDSIGNGNFVNDWKAVRRLLSWSWAWIIQEVALAASMVVRCGIDKFDWTGLIKCDCAWQSQRLIKLSTHGIWFEAMGKTDKRPLRAFRTTT